MPYKIAIVDDNPTDITYVANVVKQWAVKRDTSVNIETFPSAESFLFRYSEDKTGDILLLDIEMSGQNGIELAKMIRKDNDGVQLVFITGYPDFIAEGYDVSALHYLMKPVSNEKLHMVLDRAVNKLAKAEKHLCITFDRQTDCVPLNQIYYVEAQKQYVAIHTASQIFRMKASLADTQKQLDEYFLKCQRSFIVNLRFIKRILPDHVILKNDEKIPISRGMAETIGKKMIQLF